MIVKGITIHNTGNDLSAREIYNTMLLNKVNNLCHYLVDENETINVYPEDLEASHTGRGYDFGNRYTIAIEICRSMSDDELYSKAENNAVKLIKSLMMKYKLNKSNLYFHMDFNPQTKCPHRIMEKYQTKERFINEYNL